MPKKTSLPEQDILPGTYQLEIDSPNRSDAALVTMTRPIGWPAGDVFTYTIFERERNGVLSLITSGTERIPPSGVIIGKDGTVNPPLTIGLRWAADKDKDVIQFNITVLQPFRTAINVEFL